MHSFFISSYLHISTMCVCVCNAWIYSRKLKYIYIYLCNHVIWEADSGIIGSQKIFWKSFIYIYIYILFACWKTKEKTKNRYLFHIPHVWGKHTETRINPHVILCLLNQLIIYMRFYKYYWFSFFYFLKHQVLVCSYFLGQRVI